MAVVPELRPRRAEARRATGARPAAGLCRRLRGDEGRRHRPDTTRLRRHRRTTRRASSHRATSCSASSVTCPGRPARHRRGVLRLSRPRSPPRLDRGGRSAGEDAVVLRTFSKLFGLAGLRVGYAAGPAAVVAAMRKVQRGYDVGSLAQAAALASLGDTAEIERRRVANLAAVAALDRRAPHTRPRAARRERDELRSRRRRRRCRLARSRASRTSRRRASRRPVRCADGAPDRRGIGLRPRSARPGARCARSRPCVRGL